MIYLGSPIRLNLKLQYNFEITTSLLKLQLHFEMVLVAPYFILWKFLTAGDCVKLLKR